MSRSSMLDISFKFSEAACKSETLKFPDSSRLSQGCLFVTLKILTHSCSLLNVCAADLITGGYHEVNRRSIIHQHLRYWQGIHHHTSY
jgi:hypothetical protein